VWDLPSSQKTRRAEGGPSRGNAAATPTSRTLKRGTCRPGIPLAHETHEKNKAFVLFRVFRGEKAGVDLWAKKIFAEKEA